MVSNAEWPLSGLPHLGQRGHWPDVTVEPYQSQSTQQDSHLESGEQGHLLFRRLTYSLFPSPSRDNHAVHVSAPRGSVQDRKSIPSPELWKVLLKSSESPSSI